MTTKQQCRMLRRQGRSIGDIARSLGKSESTVHWHVSDIQLTATQRNRIRAWKRELMVEVNARRAGQPLRPIQFCKPRWSGTLVHLISHLAFDGRVDRYGCQYYNRNYQQALHVQELLHRLLKIDAKIRQRVSGIWLVSYYNVAIGHWLSCKERELLETVGRRRSWQRLWLQAFFDDEGHVHCSGSTRRVRASQHDPVVLERAQRFLQELGIASRIDRAARAVEITGQQNLYRFSRTINFAAGLAFNADRRNGLWRQPLEKRKLLQAIVAGETRLPLFQNLGR